MVPLASTADYVTMLLIAGLFGSVGGFAFELLQVRQASAAVATATVGAAAGTATGAIQLPHRLVGKERLYDLGFFASLVIGAVAAVAVLYFFPPQVSISVNAADGTAKTTTEYDVIKLVALALIVGSAGPSFLTQMQSKIQAALSEKRAETTVDVSRQQIQELKESAKEDVRTAVDGAIRAHKDLVSRTVENAARADPVSDEQAKEKADEVMNLVQAAVDEATSKFEQDFEIRAEQAQKAIAAV